MHVCSQSLVSPRYDTRFWGLARILAKFTEHAMITWSLHYKSVHHHHHLVVTLFSHPTAGFGGLFLLATQWSFQECIRICAWSWIPVLQVCSLVWNGFRQHVRDRVAVSPFAHPTACSQYCERYFFWSYRTDLVIGWKLCGSWKRYCSSASHQRLFHSGLLFLATQWGFQEYILDSVVKHVSGPEYPSCRNVHWCVWDRTAVGKRQVLRWNIIRFCCHLCRSWRLSLEDFFVPSHFSWNLFLMRDHRLMEKWRRLKGWGWLVSAVMILAACFVLAVRPSWEFL